MYDDVRRQTDRQTDRQTTEISAVERTTWGSLRLAPINPRRACAARVTVVSFCVSVCLFVYDYSRTTGYEAAYELGGRFHELDLLHVADNDVLNFGETDG